MANQSQTVQRACQILRRRVRMRNMSVTLPTSVWPHNDGPLIAETTRLYVESWIVPLLDAIEKGDTQLLNQLMGFDLGEPIGDRDNEDAH